MIYLFLDWMNVNKRYERGVRREEEEEEEEEEEAIHADEVSIRRTHPLPASISWPRWMDFRTIDFDCLVCHLLTSDVTFHITSV